MAEPPDILVADDEPHIVALLAELLTDAGYRVRTASNGRAALTAVQKQMPALILLDTMMPVHSGLEVVRILRAQGYHQLPIIMMSAVRLAEPLNRTGATDFLAKPFLLVEVLACVEHYIGVGSPDGSMVDDVGRTRAVGHYFLSRLRLARQAAAEHTHAQVRQSYQGQAASQGTPPHLLLWPQHQIAQALS